MKNISLGFKRGVLALVLIAFVGSVTGCRNTANGMGKDIEKTGEKIQEKTQ